MELAVAVASGFALALIAPSVHRVLRDGAGWALALLPAGLAVYFASLIPDMPREGLRMSIPWAPSLGLQFSLLCDGLSALMALLISGVGALVLIYAGGYFHGRREAVRLYVLLLAFMASMLGVVLADNVLTLFVFWELTSFTSYLLIGFDHERPAARAAALQALLVTGGGGLALLAGLLLLGRVGADNGLSLVDSLQLSSLLPLGEAAAAHPLYAPILILVCLGAFTKSAQVPFHFWLPGAMAAPTPVSAYLHSATMVKAGVYLLARLSPLLGGTELWTGLVGAVGGATMLTGAVLALRETDLKLVLAYTTVSALGALTLLVGLDTPHCAVAAAAYLAAHGMYKGALFLVAGAVDHSVHTRDVTQLSGLARAMPLTAVAAGLAALSMAGLPPLFGFVAKELLYDAALHGPAASAAVAVAVGASVLLVAAAAVVGVRPFLGGVSDKAKLAHEVAGSLLLGPLLLAGLGVVVGLLPGVLGDALVGGAAAAMRFNEPAPEVHLALWHGWNTALGLSIATVAAGWGVYVVRQPIRAALARLPDVGPRRVYELLLAGLVAGARWQTQCLQSGYLRHYLVIVLLTAGGLIGYALATLESWPLPAVEERLPVYAFEAALALIVMMSALATINSRSRLTAIAALGVVGYGVALLFVCFGAPDLAMTQFLVETFTLILFVLVFYHLPPSVELSNTATRLRDGAIALSIGGLMATLTLVSNRATHLPHISDFYAQNSVAGAHGRNIVNVILVDYRGLDTLGEITVLTAAAVGVHALLKLRPERGDQT